MTVTLLVVVCIASYVSSERFGILQTDGSILDFDAITLQDFSKGYEVLKEVTRRICLIASPRIHKQKNLTPDLLDTPQIQHYRIDHTDLQYADVMNIAGPIAAKFCRGYTSRFLVEIPENTVLKRESGVHFVRCTREIPDQDLILQRTEEFMADGRKDIENGGYPGGRGWLLPIIS